MKYDYAPARKLTKKEQIAREANMVGLGLPRTAAEIAAEKLQREQEKE
jgi:hypothetical protein